MVSEATRDFTVIELILHMVLCYLLFFIFHLYTAYYQKRLMSTWNIVFQVKKRNKTKLRNLKSLGKRGMLSATWDKATILFWHHINFGFLDNQAEKINWLRISITHNKWQWLSSLTVPLSCGYCPRFGLHP